MTHEHRTAADITRTHTHDLAGLLDHKGRHAHLAAGLNVAHRRCTLAHDADGWCDDLRDERGYLGRRN